MRVVVARLAAIPLILVLVFLLVRGELLSRSPVVIAGQMAGLALIGWSRVTFRRQQFRFVPEPGSGSLVRTGPYRLIRHPIYAGALLVVWSSLLGYPSWLHVGIGLIACVPMPFRISVEEEFLQGHYPEYAEYARTTKRVIPFIY